jgi:acetoin:2,6-dichlorophenolindophenol oxidoreductase subunit beta
MTITTEMGTYKAAISQALEEIMSENEMAVLMGQGVTDNIGIFGTTKFLREKYGSGRVIEMPIMEEGMTGIAVGMSLNGLYPIQTHIRVDFLLLAMNQIINSIAKYKYMYGGMFELPMLIRAVVGRSWGQGPQHSQSLQSLFAHVPGLKVVMPANSFSAYQTYKKVAAEYRGPVLSIEHRFLYDMTFGERRENLKNANIFSSSNVEIGDDITIVATSYMVQEAQLAASWLRENTGITCEIIDLHCISDPDIEPVLESVKKTGRLIVADTSWQSYGVCAEICRGICETSPELLSRPAITLGMQRSPCPTAHSLEDSFYADMSDIIKAASILTDGTFECPTKADAKVKRKNFKGPF